MCLMAQSDKNRWFWILVLQPERTSSLQQPTVWSIFRLKQVSRWKSKFQCEPLTFSQNDLCLWSHLLSLIIKMYLGTSAIVTPHQRPAPVCVKEKKDAFTFIRVSWDSYARALTVASPCLKEALLLPSLFTKWEDQGLFFRGVSAPLGVL